MIKGLMPILYTSAGIALAGTAGYFVIALNSTEPDQPAAVSEPAQEVSEPEIAALPKQEPAPSAEEETVPSTPALAVPEFTLLRVEKDGSTVVAGTGPANAVISLFDGEVLIAETNTGPEGDFAIVLDNPLKPGLHEFHLSARSESGEEVVSAQAGIIEVAEPEAQEQATVLVAESGTATRVLQKPEPKQEIASGEVDTDTPQDTTAPEDEPEADTEEVAEPQADPLEPATPVLIEAADIENDQIFIAGTGKPGANVILYFGNELLGSAKVGNKGAFLFEGTRTIPAGEHEIRADMINPATNEVIARAEVRLVHQPKEVLAENAPEPEVPPADSSEEVNEQETLQEAETTQPDRKVIRTGTTVIIRRGDNLWRVARRNYGEGTRYTTIFDANRDQIRNPDLIYPGQIFKVPEAEPGQTDNSSNG